MNPPDHFVLANSARHKDLACDITEPPSYTTILKISCNELNHLNEKNLLLFYFCPGSRVHVPGIVKHSSPP